VTTVCEATCAARDAGAPVSRHSCHQSAASQQGAAMVAIHVCGHDDESLPTALERMIVAPDTPAVTSTMTVMMPPPRQSFSRIAFVDSSPPTPLTLISQLRI
jgi:hypothetical protein